MTERPTIVGIATGTPDGGVSVVRISGSMAGNILAELIGKQLRPRMLSLARLQVGDGFEQILAVWMPGPASFTGEDVVELHIHAGSENTREVTEAILQRGAVAAKPGEFSRRAFANGKMTLDQAEGVAALIGAQTQAALHQARRLVAGELGRTVAELRAQVWELLCEIEANLDFPEDVDTNSFKRWTQELEQFETILDGWARRFEHGRRARECARFVLAGPPNAGKSALFNRLIGRGRSIVSSVPGTTRDYVEASLDLGPYRALLVDTAGVRTRADDGGELLDAVEVEGIDRSRDQMAGADIVIWVESAEALPVSLPQLEGVEVVRVENKRDLVARGFSRRTVFPDVELRETEHDKDHGLHRTGHSSRDTDGWIGVSAQTGDGCETLCARLRAWFSSGGDDAWIGLARHRDRAHDALQAVTEARELLQGQAGLELVAFSLDVARRRLDEITGRSDLGPVGADLLNSIFGKFCIGK